MRYLKTAFAIATTLLLPQACGTDDTSRTEVCNYDIVCIKSRPAGQGIVFSMYLPDSDDEILYTEQRGVIDNAVVPVGDRVMIAYLTDTPYVSGNITVKGYSTIHNDVLTVSEKGVDSDMPDWHRDGIYLYSIWRSGNFLNVRARLTYSTEPRELMLVVDAADIEARRPHPTLRLIYRLADPAENFERQTYASFDISALWQAPWIKGFDVELANTNLTVDTFTFNKKPN